MRIRSVLAILAAAVIPAASSLAQDRQGADARLTLRFVAERAPEALGPVAIASGENRSDAFVLPERHLSDPVVMQGRSAALVSVEQNARIANLKAPETGRDFVVLLIPAETGGYQGVFVPAKDPSFRPGDAYFYNHSDAVIIGYVGRTSFSLSPGQGRVVRPTQPREEGFYDVGFGVRSADGDRPLHDTRWPVETNIRSYIFFFSNPRTGNPTFRAVDEFIAID
jgi:hypothetical protein